MRYQNLFPKHLILNSYFAFSVTSNRDFGKFLKIISQGVLVKLQTDTFFAQSLSSTYDELLISRICFSITSFFNTFFTEQMLTTSTDVKMC